IDTERQTRESLLGNCSNRQLHDRRKRWTRGERVAHENIFAARARAAAPRSALLIGPYDPMGGEYTFLAPPLGVWRVCGVLQRAGHETQGFDPNCCDGAPL